MSKDTSKTAMESDRGAVVDAMVIDQYLDKPKSIKTCKDVSDYFFYLYSVPMSF